MCVYYPHPFTQYVHITSVVCLNQPVGVRLAVPTVTSEAIPIESEACPAGADKAALCVVTVVGTLPIADLTLIHICTQTYAHTHTHSDVFRHRHNYGRFYVHKSGCNATILGQKTKALKQAQYHLLTLTL